MPAEHNKQYSQETDIHAAGEIRTYIPSKRAAIDLRLRPRGHWDRLLCFLLIIFEGADKVSFCSQIHVTSDRLPSVLTYLLHGAEFFLRS
jgi:hypothetical protein